MTKINRTISVGIAVESPSELPKVGEYVAKFLRRVDVEHGPFDVTIGLTVNGFENTPKSGATIVNNYYNDGDYPYEEEEGAA